MTEDEARALFDELLKEVGVEAGDTLYLAVDMAHIPLPAYTAKLSREAIEGRERKWCAFVLESLHNAVGDAGTILAPAFSYDYARRGAVYEHETSPSETGPFTEYFRQIADVRSFHPLHSIAGLGSKAAEILEDSGRAAFGARSPYARFPDHNVKFLFLGAPLGDSLTYVHHLEHLYGVNHMYHKVFNVPARRGGKDVPGPYLAFVRYLGTNISAAVDHVEERLRSEGLLVESRIWDMGPFQLAHVADVDQVTFAMLDENPISTIAEPAEVHIEAEGAFEQPRSLPPFSYRLDDPS